MYLTKSIPTSIGYNATIWIIKSYQVDNIAQIMDVTLLGFETSGRAASVATMQSIAVQQIRLQGTTYPVTAITPQGGQTQPGVLHAAIFAKIIQTPGWTDAVFSATAPI